MSLFKQVKEVVAGYKDACTGEICDELKEKFPELRKVNPRWLMNAVGNYRIKIKRDFNKKSKLFHKD